MSSLRTELAQFAGSTMWFRHGFNRAVIYTEGVRHLAEAGHAYWLVDVIAAHLASHELQAAFALDQRVGLMHFWKLAVAPDHTATLEAVADQGEQPFIHLDIPFTDFPLDAIDVWAKNDSGQWTLLLPSEY